MKKHLLLLITGFMIVSCGHKPGVEIVPGSSGKLGTNSSSLSGVYSMRRPQQADDPTLLIRYEYREKEITGLCDDYIKSTEARLNVWQKENEAKSSISVQALLDYESVLADFSDELQPLTFMGSVSTVKYIRDEASACEEKTSVFQNKISTTKAYYNILKKVTTSETDEARLLKETLFGFEMAGMSLPDDKLLKFKELMDKLTGLTVQFSQNLNNDTSSVSFKAEELKGAKDSFLERLKKDKDGLYIVTTKAPDYVHVIENVEVAETRKRMMFAYYNRQGEVNTKLLQDAIKVRSEMGQLMGSKTFADYSLRQKMAKDSATVFKFLNGLVTKLAKRNRADLRELASFKKTGLKDSTPFQVWDASYVSNQLKKKKFNIDDEALREYFPAEHVTEQVFNVYSQLLGVRYKRIPNAKTWAPQVDLYEVSDSKTQDVIGYFFTDFIPREGKYGHAAAFPLRAGRVLDGQNYLKPIASIVANFAPAAPGKPVLLSHEEVETFFHEFGHIMHNILTKAKYASLSGSNVKWDFVEAPSQMLENWVWEKEILSKLSKDPKKPTGHLPDKIIRQLQSSRFFGSGLMYTRQLIYGLFDMNIHTNPDLDVTAEYGKVYQTLSGMKPLENIHVPASFGHLMGGYAAGYYGYLWSKVFAEDMYSKFKAKGILSPIVGGQYRKEILEKGNMEDPMILLKKFLGREPNNKAFFKSLGITK